MTRALNTFSLGRMVLQDNPWLKMIKIEYSFKIIANLNKPIQNTSSWIGELRLVFTNI